MITEEHLPGPKVSEAGTELEIVIKDNVDTYHHPVGTCKMGLAKDKKAVIDSHGKVYGIV